MPEIKSLGSKKHIYEGSINRTTKNDKVHFVQGSCDRSFSMSYFEKIEIHTYIYIYIIQQIITCITLHNLTEWNLMITVLKILILHKIILKIMTFRQVIEYQGLTP